MQCACTTPNRGPSLPDCFLRSLVGLSVVLSVAYTMLLLNHKVGLTSATSIAHLLVPPHHAAPAARSRPPPHTRPPPPPPPRPPPSPHDHHHCLHLQNKATVGWSKLKWSKLKRLSTVTSTVTSHQTHVHAVRQLPAQLCHDAKALRTQRSPW